MATTQQTTIAAVERNPPEGNWELINGELIPGNPTSLHAAAVVARSLTFLNAHVLANNAGLVVGPDAGFVIFADRDTVRAPDVAFVRRGRLPAPSRTFVTVPPDLAVEVLSPSDRHADTL